jgi:hypothetical protein
MLMLSMRGGLPTKDLASAIGQWLTVKHITSYQLRDSRYGESLDGYWGLEKYLRFGTAQHSKGQMIGRIPMTNKT